MKKFIFILVVSCFFAVNGQEFTVKAEKGDGIFSLLRKQGIDPAKYYTEFVDLNLTNLKNGSELYLGREYIIPNAPDSFKKMALSVTEEAYAVSPIFQEELSTIAPKSDKLKNAVIYLLPTEKGNQNSGEIHLVKQQIVKNIAHELMINGAKVYLIDGVDIASDLVDAATEQKGSNEENPIATQEQMQQYVEIINELSLKNAGKYQRLLVVNLNESVKNSRYFEVSVFHNGKNTESERFAKSLQVVLNEHSVVNGKKEHTEIFTNSNNLYLATNVLPPVTMLDIGDTRNPSIEERISIASREEILPNIVTSGVLTDYANISLEK